MRSKYHTYNYMRATLGLTAWPINYKLDTMHFQNISRHTLKGVTLRVSTKPKIKSSQLQETCFYILLTRMC